MKERRETGALFPSMIEQLNTYDWESAFGYAGEPNENGYGVPEEPRFTAGNVSTEPFTREDVVEISNIIDGENDEADWVIVGRLKDDRWFALIAGCDYTGWDCQASGKAFVAQTYDDIVRWALGASERDRLGIILTDPQNMV